MKCLLNRLEIPFGRVDDNVFTLRVPIRECLPDNYLSILGELHLLDVDDVVVLILMAYGSKVASAVLDDETSLAALHGFSYTLSRTMREIIGT